MRFTTFARCLPTLLLIAALTTAAEENPTAGKPYTQKILGSQISFTLVPIPAGKFTMGSPKTEPGRKTDEGPQFTVEVDPFWMANCTVTQAEYNVFLDQYGKIARAGAPVIPRDKLADAVTYPTPIYAPEVDPILKRMGMGGKYSAVTLSQFAAGQYTKWLSKRTGRFYRLPTEAEWEYAARAGTNNAYSFGDDPKQLPAYSIYIDNADKNGDGTYRETGSKKPNPWGLYDMHGNVSQWCIDGYHKDWYQPFAGKTVKWNQIINWPKNRYPRAIRGGSWESEAAECRSAARRGSDPKMNIQDANLPQSPHWDCNSFWIGFRVISPIKEPTDAEKLKFWDLNDPETTKTLERDREVRDIPTREK